MSHLAPLTLVLALLPVQEPAASLPAEGAPRRTEVPEGGVSVPIDLSSGWPVLEVEVDGRGPFRMILDTGAMGCVLNADLARELGLAVLGKTRLGDPSDPGAREADRIEIPSLGIGAARFEGFEGVAWERPPGLERTGVRGVVGLPVFAGCLLTLDYPRGEIRLAKGALPEPNEDVLAFQRDSFGAITLPIEVAGVRVDAHLDSGNARSIGLPGRLEEELPLVAGTKRKGRGMRASGPVEFTSAQLDGMVRIAGVELENPEVRFDAKLVAGNLGQSFLSRCALTIDQAGSRVEVVPFFGSPVVKRVEAGGGRRRLGIEMELGGGDDGLRVSRVVPGSLAETIGLAAGDLLVAVSGRAVTVEDRSALEAALSKPDGFRLTVERAGERLELEVPPEG